jgi:hypothetical protein
MICGWQFMKKAALLYIDLLPVALRISLQPLIAAEGYFFLS